MKITTLEMELALMHYLKFEKNLTVPALSGTLNTLFRFEVDICSLSKSSYATGVEIKISKSDLKKDLKKKQWKSIIDAGPLFARSFTAPNYFEKFKHFYYAVPTFLIEATEDQIPRWCGILEVYQDGGQNFVRQHRRSIIINKYKWHSIERYTLARLGAIRIYNLKKKILKLEAKHNFKCDPTNMTCNDLKTACSVCIEDYRKWKSSQKK